MCGSIFSHRLFCILEGHAEVTVWSHGAFSFINELMCKNLHHDANSDANISEAVDVPADSVLSLQVVMSSVR